MADKKNDTSMRYDPGLADRLRQTSAVKKRNQNIMNELFPNEKKKESQMGGFVDKREKLKGD
jgi:hypothetical protein